MTLFVTGGVSSFSIQFFAVISRSYDLPLCCLNGLYTTLKAKNSFLRLLWVVHRPFLSLIQAFFISGRVS